MERVGGNSDLERSINIDPHDISKIDNTHDTLDLIMEKSNDKGLRASID